MAIGKIGDGGSFQPVNQTKIPAEETQIAKATLGTKVEGKKNFTAIQQPHTGIAAMAQFILGRSQS